MFTVFDKSDNIVFVEMVWKWLPGSAAMLSVGSASVLSRSIGKKNEGTIKKIMVIRGEGQPLRCGISKRKVRM